MRTADTIAQYRYYTYLLIDPADGQVFYVGKGQGDRINAHVRETKADKRGLNPRKGAKIREILKHGDQVQAVIFSRHDDEDEALDAEDLLITALTGPNLTNIAGSRALHRREWAQLLLARTKSFEHWIATCGQDNLDFATRFSGSPRAHYDRHIAAIKQEGERVGSNTIMVYVPALALLHQGPWVRHAHR